ncbi:hypothetical protein EYV96_16210 [Dyella terrae]|uniref:Uncharacterized protein n=3 Tax=Rhodanobacteraceae TaxID=1775411 RepID=A0A4R0YGZ6_9GAMM|nr:hypothetical protein EYV96_16210 [Dyella terrae]TCI06272.1 hypothetical protein EZM97_35300 [Dyella soli]
MGQDANLRDAAASELEQALDEAQIEQPVRDAIRAQDGEQLQALLGKGPMFAVLMPDEDEDEEGEGEGEDEEGPAEDRLTSVVA